MKKKTNIFADYFYNVFITEQPRFIPTMPRANNKTEMDTLNITEDTILSILKERNISKSPGPDELNTRLLMELSDIICHPPCTLFQTSLKTSCIHDNWNDWMQT